MITLGPAWKTVLLKAWSVRFIVLSFLCDAAAIVLVALGVFSGNPRAFIVFQIAGAVFGLAALVARITYQRGVS